MEMIKRVALVTGASSGIGKATDHWYMHRGQLADARRAAGLERRTGSDRFIQSVQI